MKINPITTDQYPIAAKRQMNRRMSKGKVVEVGLDSLLTWKRH